MGDGRTGGRKEGRRGKSQLTDLVALELVIREDREDVSLIDLALPH